MVYSTSDMKITAIISVWFPLHLGSSQQKFPEGAPCDQQTKLGNDEKAKGVCKFSREVDRLSASLVQK